MFELRRLRLGDQPVTGSGADAVRQFFHRTADESSSSRDTAEHRPEAIIVEVQGLVERRPVSSILNSPNFRSRLEATVRSSMEGSVLRRQSPITPREGARSQTVQAAYLGE